MYTTVPSFIQVSMPQTWFFLVRTIFSLNTCFAQLIKYAKLLYIFGLVISNEKDTV